MRSAVVVDAVRTPVARAHPAQGFFRDRRADDLSADVMTALLDRAGVPSEAIEDIHWGCVKQQQEQGYDIAKLAALIAGFPLTAAGATVNRNCGSGLQALHQAVQSIMADCEDVQIAGGVEHMHHIPMEQGLDFSPRLFYRHAPAIMHMGLTAENVAARYRVSRQEQDEFALASHQRALAATDRGQFLTEITPTWGRDEDGRKDLLEHDQGMRRDTTVEALAALRPAFLREGGTVTAGNSSQLSVGAAALLLMSEERARQWGLSPLARVRSMAVSGVEPSLMGLGPVPATHKALKRAGLQIADIELFEVNEAFAAQTIAVMRLLDLDPEKVNVRGGAIALGHPLGASGARVATTLLHAMRQRGAALGLATMCIGGGQGIATVFEACNAGSATS